MTPPIVAFVHVRQATFWSATTLGHVMLQNGGTENTAARHTSSVEAAITGRLSCQEQETENDFGRKTERGRWQQ